MATHEELVEFINNHETQLITSGIPKIYWTKLCEKLKQEVSYPILIMIFRINMVLFKTIFFKLEYVNKCKVPFAVFPFSRLAKPLENSQEGTVTPVSIMK